MVPEGWNRIGNDKCGAISLVGQHFEPGDCGLGLDIASSIKVFGARRRGSL